MGDQMKVWFHTTIEQSDDEESYDSMTDSELFATKALAIKDAERVSKIDYDNNMKYYNGAIRRCEIRQQALEVLEAADLDASEVMWRASSEPSPFRLPPQRYIYFLEVGE